MPGVHAVTVRPVPNAIRENDIALDVQGSVTVAGVKQWCDERLSVYKRPSSISLANGGA